MTTEDKFKAAVNVIKSLPRDGPYQPSREMKLLFYGLFKQAMEGPCTEPKPAFYQIVAGYKWQAWKAVGNISKTEAMEKYVSELKKIVETMAYSADVATFMEVLGPFYEYVDVTPSNNNENSKEEKNHEDVFDGDSEVSQIGTEQEEVLLHQNCFINDESGKEEYELAEKLGTVIITGSAAVSKGSNNTITASAQKQITGIPYINGNPYRNGHIHNGNVISNGINNRNFRMSPHVSPTDDHKLQQQQDSLDVASSCQAFTDSNRPQVPEAEGARFTSDTDTDEEYSEPSESLEFCSGSSQGVPSPLPLQQQLLESSIEKNRRPLLSNTSILADEGLPSSCPSLSPPDAADVTGTIRNILTMQQQCSTATCVDYLASSSMESTPLGQHNGGVILPVPSSNNSVTFSTSTKHDSAVAAETRVSALPQPSQCEVHTSSAVQTYGHHDNNKRSSVTPLQQEQGPGSSSNAPSPRDATVLVLRQMQGDLHAMTRCLQEQLNDISQCLAALHRTSLALQTHGGGNGGGSGNQSPGRSEVQQRRRRQWWPFPELSPRSTFWLLLWPVLLQTVVRVVAMAINRRRRRAGRY